MQFALMVLALGVATGVAGARLSFDARRRGQAASRLSQGQAVAAQARIDLLESALAAADAARAAAQHAEGEARRRHAELMAAVSRHMRAPLESVLGFADLLLAGDAAPPLTHRQSRAVERIREAAGRLLPMVEGLRVLAGAEHPARGVETSTDPLLIAARVCSRLEQTAQAVGVALPPPSPQAGVNARIDAETLERILFGLIGHAVKQSRSGGRVAIAARRAADTVQLTVRDAGPSLAEREAEGFFEMDDGPGLLGLGAVRRLAQAAGADLDVEAVEGEGAVFTLRLKAAMTGARFDASSRPADVALSGVVLYVCRDKASIALMRQMAQASAGLQIHVAPDEAEGLALARDLRPDALILDLELFSDGGARMLARLRSQPCAAPVLGLSASPMTEAAAGLAAVLARPVPLGVLTAALSNLLAADGRAAFGTAQTARSDGRRRGVE